MNIIDEASVLYKQAVEYEKKQRLNLCDKEDYILADKLREELRIKLDVESNYLCDLTYRKIIDDKCIPILIKYIPLFKNIGISLDLITQQLYRKNNKECSNFLENWYYELKKNNKLTSVVENTLDNVFVKIRDKDKIPFYIKLIKENNKFPFVMEMLGKWNVIDAKPIIINRLENDGIKTSSIRALGYYNDKATIPLIEKYVESDYLGVRKEAKKVMDKLSNL